MSFRGVKLSYKDENRLESRTIEETSDNKVVFAGNHDLIGGTAWLFSRPEMDKTLDYLFVDEAGQVSLADIVASGLSADNIVLVGDQMQLPQVSQGAASRREWRLWPGGGQPRWRSLSRAPWPPMDQSEG